VPRHPGGGVSPPARAEPAAPPSPQPERGAPRRAALSHDTRTSTLMRRALVIAPNWIGDALMAQPLFALLKKLHPRIVIDAVAPTWVAPVLERMPEVHDVYATDLAHGK